MATGTPSTSSSGLDLRNLKGYKTLSNSYIEMDVYSTFKNNEESANVYVSLDTIIKCSKKI